MVIGDRIRRRLAALCLAAALVPAGMSLAQPADPPYETDLLRLAEILGALHYLQELCGADAHPPWRDEMAALLDAEQPTDTRRAELVDRFNLGYSSFAAVYRSCTPAAATAVDRYAREGLQLSRGIIARYGQ